MNCSMSLRVILCDRRGEPGGLWADQVQVFLGEYPFLRVLRLAVPLLQRVTFDKRLKSNQKVFTLTFGPRCGSGSFAPGLIRGHRLRFASLHLLSMMI
jgi:hypothetical protein